MDVEVAEEEPGTHARGQDYSRKNGSEECFIFHISSRNFIEIRLSTVK